MSKRTQVARALRGLVLATSSLVCADVDAGEPERPSYRLLWIRDDEAASCPGPSAIARGIRERLGYDPFRDDARAAIEAHVDRSGGVWAVSIRFSDGTRETTKRFESPSADCAAVAQAAELAISLAIQGNELARADGARLPAAPEAAAGPAPTGAATTAEGERTRAPSERMPAPTPPALEGMLAVSALGAVGPLPRPAVGFDVHGLVRFRKGAYVSLGMAHLPDVRAEDSSFRLGSTLGRVGACLDPTASVRPRLVGCAHVELGSTVVVVQELLPTAPGSKVFGGASAGLLFVQPLRPFALLVEAEAMVPLPAYDFSVSGTGRLIYASPFVYGFLRVGLGFGSF